jgi:hypothetical protein
MIRPRAGGECNGAADLGEPLSNRTFLCVDLQAS